MNEIMKELKTEMMDALNRDEDGMLDRLKADIVRRD